MAEKAAETSVNNGAKPLDASPLLKTRYYTLTYKLFAGQKPQTKNFEFAGDKQQAILEGRRHCKEMNYLFIDVSLFIVDLKHQEALKHSDPEYNEKRYTGNEPILGAKQ